MQPGGRHLILVVDDDELLRDVICALLERHGYDTVAASTGVQALEVCAASPTIDLVLSDIEMPGLNGHELARRLGERYPILPIILMSGGGEPDIRKPFTSAELQRAIELALGSARRRVGRQEKRRRRVRPKRAR